MAIIMGKGCIEAIYGLMGWKGLRLPYRRQRQERMGIDLNHYTCYVDLILSNHYTLGMFMPVQLPLDLYCSDVYESVAMYNVYHR